MKDVIIYTDGACRGNPGIGGWGVLMSYQEEVKELYGGEVDTTNNKMELRAVIEGLNTLKEPCSVKVFTDSKYVMDGINSWIHNWKKNNWKTAAKKPVANRDLWIEISDLNEKMTVQWNWVKGHAGDPGNERADELANMGAESV